MIKNIIAVSLIIAMVVSGACSPAQQYTLTTNVEPDGAGTVSSGGTYSQGEKVQVTAKANEGYTFNNWSGGVSGTSPATTIVMDTDKTVIAHFTEAQTVVQKLYSVSISILPAEAGTVTPESGMYDEGTELNLVAAPASGYVFKWWTGDVVSPDESVNLIVDTNKEIVANFEMQPVTVAAKQYTLTTSVQPEAGGQITPAGEQINIHAKVTVTAEAAEGYVFHHWEGDATGTDATQIFNMDSDMNLKAIFEEKGELTFTSLPFSEGGNIPAVYTCSGEDMSPPFSWYGAPYGTASFVLIAEDMDAPYGVYTQWVLYNIPSAVRSLTKGIPVQAELENGMKQGINQYTEFGYTGPCPNPGERHEYRFTFYALDIVLDLVPQAATKSGIMNAIQGHILEEMQISGYYQK